MPNIRALLDFRTIRGETRKGRRSRSSSVGIDDRGADGLGSFFRVGSSDLGPIIGPHRIFVGIHNIIDHVRSIVLTCIRKYNSVLKY